MSGDVGPSSVADDLHALPLFDDEVSAGPERSCAELFAQRVLESVSFRAGRDGVDEPSSLRGSDAWSAGSRDVEDVEVDRERVLNGAPHVCDTAAATAVLKRGHGIALPEGEGLNGVERWWCCGAPGEKETDDRRLQAHRKGGALCASHDENLNVFCPARLTDSPETWQRVPEVSRVQGSGRARLQSCPTARYLLLYR